MKYEQDIQDIENVEFEGELTVVPDVSFESSKFGKEYGVVCMEEDPTWDRSLYTPEQNTLIENNLQDVIDGMCDQYEEEINPKPDIFKAIARALNHKNWMMIAAIGILASCSPASRAKHFNRIHPNGMWTLKGYVLPKQDTTILKLKKQTSWHK